jgi:hypothetical protein
MCVLEHCKIVMVCAKENELIISLPHYHAFKFKINPCISELFELLKSVGVSVSEEDLG